MAIELSEAEDRGQQYDHQYQDNIKSAASTSSHHDNESNDNQIRRTNNKLTQMNNLPEAAAAATNKSAKLQDNDRVKNNGASDADGQHQTAGQQQKPFKAQLVWTNIVLFVILHSSIPISLYLGYSQRPWRTLIFSLFGSYASAVGVTAGSHRLWSHKSYKAKWPVETLLVILQTMAGQNSVYTWSRDHRVHHKFSETDADPHNIKRGFFFAHMGWLCCKKHPDVKEKGKVIDMSDLEANAIVMFQHKHFWWMAIAFTVLVPTMIPVLLWGERFWTSFIFSFMLRYVVTLHGTWLVNSAAHYHGSRPYDEKMEARESPFVIFNGVGEGFHNYHHTFPYDYATSEYGRYFNITTTFIDLCAALGLVSDRRKVDPESILKRRVRTGDLTETQAADLRLKRALTSNGDSNQNQNKQVRRRGILKRSTIEENDEQLASHGNPQEKGNSTQNGNGTTCNPLTPLNNIIHELPYISGLTSMKYTM